MDIPISDRAAAAFLLARLTRCGWRFALDGAGDLAVTFGDDPPRWSQQEAMAHVVRLLEEVKTLVRGWPDAPGSATTVH